MTLSATRSHTHTSLYYDVVSCVCLSLFVFVFIIYAVTWRYIDSVNNRQLHFMLVLVCAVIIEFGIPGLELNLSEFILYLKQPQDMQASTFWAIPRARK